MTFTDYVWKLLINTNYINVLTYIYRETHESKGSFSNFFSTDRHEIMERCRKSSTQHALHSSMITVHFHYYVNAFDMH